jgi:hypothetical protein
VVRISDVPNRTITASLDLVDDGVGELSCMFFLDTCDAIPLPGGVLCGDTASDPNELSRAILAGGTAYLFIDTEKPRDFTLELTVTP